MALQNFDKVVREERKIQVGGEVADVSRIPSRVTTSLLEALDSGEISEDDPKAFTRTLALVASVCTVSNPKMTADFLLDHTDFETLYDLISYVMEPVRRKATEQTKNG